MIPKTLHQVWLGNSQPRYMQAFCHNWRRLHPDWEYRLWSARELRTMGLGPLLDRCTTFASQSNVARLHVVNQFGGVYADCDIDWIKSLNPLLETTAFAAEEIPGNYCNAIFGAAPRQPWTEYQIDKLAAYVLKPPPWGPSLMTEACRRFTITTYPTNYFYPYLYDSGPFPTAQFPDSYAVHHWSLSWTETDRSARCEQFFSTTRPSVDS